MAYRAVRITRVRLRFVARLTMTPDYEDMYWLAATSFLFGTICGAVLRLPAFIIVAAVFLAFVIIVNLSPEGRPVGAAILAIVTIQIGYGVGLITRAVLRTRHDGREAR